MREREEREKREAMRSEPQRTIGGLRRDKAATRQRTEADEMDQAERRIPQRKKETRERERRKGCETRLKTGEATDASPQHQQQRTRGEYKRKREREKASRAEECVL